MDKQTTSNSDNTSSNLPADQNTTMTCSSADNFNPNIVGDHNEDELQEEVMISVNISPGPSTHTDPKETTENVLPTSENTRTKFFSPRSSISCILHSSCSCEDL